MGASRRHGERRAMRWILLLFVRVPQTREFRRRPARFEGEKNCNPVRGRVVAPYYGHWISTSWATAWPGSLGGLGTAWHGCTCLVLIGRWGGGRGPEVDLMEATRGAAHSRWWLRYLASVLPALPRETKSPPRPQRLLDRGIACPGLPSSGGLRLSVGRVEWPRWPGMVGGPSPICCLSINPIARRVSPGPSSSSNRTGGCSVSFPTYR